MVLMNDAPAVADFSHADCQAAVGDASANRQQTMCEGNLIVGHDHQLTDAETVRSSRIAREEELPSISVSVDAPGLDRLGHIEHHDVVGPVCDNALQVSLADGVAPVIDESVDCGFIAVTGHGISLWVS